MNINIVIPLDQYDKESDRKKLVQDLRDLADKIEQYDRLTDVSQGIPHLESMGDLIHERFPASFDMPVFS